MKNYFNQSSSVLYYNYIFILMLKFTNLRTAFICNIIHKEKTVKLYSSSYISILEGNIKFIENKQLNSFCEYYY